MGQKINPIGMRLGINRGWDSTWFAKKKDFGRYLIEDFKIRNYIKKNIVNSGVSEIKIERSSKKCTVSIHTSRPGFVIGKKGADIEKIKKNIMKITSGDVNVNIKEIKKPESLESFDHVINFTCLVRLASLACPGYWYLGSTSCLIKQAR